MRRTAAIILLAMLGIGSFSSITTLAGADTQIQGTWVTMRGIITSFGENRVFGHIGSHAGMVTKNDTYREWARAHAIWSYEPRRLNCSGSRPPPENFTFTFYAARLVNTTDVSLDQPGYNFYISGLWNVVSIETTITVITGEEGQIINVTFTREFETTVLEGQGELRVFSSWSLFELSIEGIDLLKGFVAMVIIRHVEIKICDVTGPNDEPDGKVNLLDLVRVAKRYRTIPGLWDYDHHIDFNFNNEIDLGDLTTIAANIDG